MEGIIDGDVQEWLRVRELLGIGPSGQIDAWLAYLFLPKMPSGANSFEINEIQEEETEVAITKRCQCNNIRFG